MINDDFYFIEMMKAITEPLMQEVMTDEQAAKDAIAEHRTEMQQARMMGGSAREQQIEYWVNRELVSLPVCEILTRKK